MQQIGWIENSSSQREITIILVGFDDFSGHVTL